MTHHTDFIGTIAVGFTAAFIFALVAVRLRLPPIVGFLLAGVAVGPFTPGFVADTDLAPQLAEVGVILLMFGVGTHISPRDLLAVKGIAIPGAILQSIATTAIGIALARFWGWPTGQALVFGLALSIASTVVLLRALQQLNTLNTPGGQLAVGWLVVEDLITVVILVLLPSVASALDSNTRSGSFSADLGALVITLGKVGLFAVVMIVVGWRLIPWLLLRMKRTDSPELLLLATLAAALGIAYGGSEVFGVSPALGAFVAGLVVGQSEVGHEAAQQVLGLQEAFAVLFFVSVGMLIEPEFLIAEPLKILVVSVIIVVCKPLIAAAIVLIMRGGFDKALTVAAGVGQIGEFSFILATLGLSLDILPAEGYDLILAGALVSITINPLLFHAANALRKRLVPQNEAVPAQVDLQPGASGTG